MPIKVLYEFSISKDEEIEKIEESTNEAGETVKTTKRIKSAVPYKFYVAKPTRSLIEGAELFRAVKFSEAVRGGVLTHDLLSKRLKNDDGLLSTSEKEHYEKIYKNLYEIHIDLQKANEKPEVERTEGEKKDYDVLLEKLRKSRQTIRDFETSKSGLFNFTAETYARGKVIFWWLLNLAYKDNGKDPESLFDGKNFEEKATKYDELEEKNDAFLNQVVQEFMYYVTLWFISEVSNPEQFKKLVEETRKEDLNS